mgnify:CR=1 FL=1
MELKPKEEISAQVILREAGGRRISEENSVTSNNLDDYLPEDRTAAKAREAFSKMGFTVGSIVGVIFSITGKVETFEEVFNRSLRREDRGIVLADGPTEGDQEYSDEDLPSEVISVVDKVVFESPPDFGPTDF